MKKKKSIEYAELVKYYYGAARPGELQGPESLDELIAGYYGLPSRPRKVTKSPALPMALSLSHDDGELLRQKTRRSHGGRLTRQSSMDGRAYEEYIVGCESNHPAVTQAQSLANDTVQPEQEYVVDLLQPLDTPAAALPVSPPATATAPPAQAAVGPSQPAPYYPPTPMNASPATTPDSPQVTEDDFLADMKAILSGQKRYDADQGKAVGVADDRRSTGNNGSSNGLPSEGENKDRQIFERLTQSMTYANAYDLGTVELENRFASFDRDDDLQRAARKKPKGEVIPATPVSQAPTISPNLQPAPVTNPGQVSNEDFLHDLDEMQRQSTNGDGAAAVRAPISATNQFVPPVEAYRSAADQTVPASTARQASLTGQDAYSQPFFDTGEHVLAGEDQYVGRLHVGRPPGVAFSYGQIIAMADLYEDDNQMMQADLNELNRLKTLIERSTNYYKGNKRTPALDVKNKEWDDNTGKRYLKLAEENYEHFSPNLIFRDATAINAQNRHGNNQQKWQKYHRRAIIAMQQLVLQHPNASPFPETPLIINAFGDHFLTDAFSAGHLINKDVMLAYFKQNFFNGNNLKPEANTFFDQLAAKAFVGPVRDKFSRLETASSYRIWGIPIFHPNINSASRFAEVLKGIAVQATDQVGNLAVKALHDRLNEDGIDVTNQAGDQWKIFGDGFLLRRKSDGTIDRSNLDMLQKAVQQSIDNINDPAILASNLNFPAFFERVWRFVPQPTAASTGAFEALVREYTSPASFRLIDAAAELIKDQVDILVEKILDAGALRKA